MSDQTEAGALPLGEIAKLAMSAAKQGGRETVEWLKARPGLPTGPSIREDRPGHRADSDDDGYSWDTLQRVGDPFSYAGDNNLVATFYREYMRQNPGITPQEALVAAEKRARGDKEYVDDGRTKMKMSASGVAGAAHFGAGLPPGFIPLPPPSERKAEDARPPGFQEVKPPWQGDGRGVVGGAVMDTLGLTDRPGADNPVRVVTKPETFAESLIPAAIAAPLIYAGGAGGGAMGLPAVAGRVLASGAVGAAQSAGRGEDVSKMGIHGLLDAAVSGLTEGVGGAVTKAVGKVGAPARAFEYASEAPQKALDALRSRLRGARVVVPSLGSAKLTLDEAVQKLATLEGSAYRVARAEIADWIKRLDTQTVPKPNAGQVFKDQTSKQRFQPPTLSSIADKIAGALKSPEVRAAMDSLMVAPFPGARAPLGAVAGAALAGSPLVKHIPGARKVSEVVEEAE